MADLQGEVALKERGPKGDRPPSSAVARPKKETTNSRLSAQKPNQSRSERDSCDQQLDAEDIIGPARWFHRAKYGELNDLDIVRKLFEPKSVKSPMKSTIALSAVGQCPNLAQSRPPKLRCGPQVDAERVARIELGA